MSRTNVAAVQSMLGDNYGVQADGNPPNLQQYVDGANLTVDEVVRQALAAWPPYQHTNAQLEFIERCLACHYYTKMDPTYTSRSTMGRSGSFVRGKEEAEPYKDMALNQDPSGQLHSILNNLRAGATWLGRPYGPAGYLGPNVGPWGGGNPHCP